MLGEGLRDGKVAVCCPWAGSHTDSRGCGSDSSTVLLPPTSDKLLGAFVCAHAHCGTQTLVDVVRVLPKNAIAIAAARFPRALGSIGWRLPWYRRLFTVRPPAYVKSSLGVGNTLTSL